MLLPPLLSSLLLLLLLHAPNIADLGYFLSQRMKKAGKSGSLEDEVSEGVMEGGEGTDGDEPSERTVAAPFPSRSMPLPLSGLVFWRHWKKQSISLTIF